MSQEKIPRSLKACREWLEDAKMDKESKKEQEHKVSAEHSNQIDTKVIVMMVMLGLLVLVSAIQAVELLNLKEKLSDGALTVSTASSKIAVGAGAGASGSGLSKNLENLPSMVGGC